MEKDIVWGGSGIEHIVFEHIKNTIPDEATIIELGGGDCSTRAFSSIANLYTVEHDNRFLNHDDLTTYIYAPIKDGWYDRKKLAGKLPNKYDLVFIDGPSGAGLWLRSGILNNLGLFKEETTFVLHDTWREQDCCLASDLAQTLNKKIVYYEEGNPIDYWAVVK